MPPWACAKRVALKLDPLCLHLVLATLRYRFRPQRAGTPAPSVLTQEGRNKDSMWINLVCTLLDRRGKVYLFSFGTGAFMGLDAWRMIGKWALGLG